MKRTAVITATMLGLLALTGAAQADTTVTPLPVDCPADVIAYALSPGEPAEPTAATGPGQQTIVVTIPDLPETRQPRADYACTLWADAHGVTVATPVPLP